jgi:glycosyltransferase involved in cell wall biosynthesis
MIVSFPRAAKSQSLIVLHVIPTLEGGGAERQLTMLATEQARRGYDVHLAVRRTGVHMQVIRGCGVQIHELGDMPSINPRLLLAMKRVIAEIRPSIVQTWLPQMDILGALAALPGRIPWIVSERTSGNYYKEVPIIAWLRVLLGQFASAIVANSDGGAKYWRTAAYRSPKLVTVRNALDFGRIREAAAPDLSESLPNPVLLVVGRFSREKALEIIVRSLSDFSRVRAVDVLVIGEGSERPTLEKEIEAASLSGRVKVLPYQPDWWRWLKVADGLISMSRYEGNPNVVLEAMAGCCPVILSDIPAHREIADASSALFVPVDDVSALSSAMEKLIADKDAALRRAERAFGRVESMTVTAMADAYETVYRDVLDGID